MDGDKENNNDSRSNENKNDGDDYIVESEESSSKTAESKKRKKLSEPAARVEDPLPAEYQHLRKNINTVKPEFYQVTDRIKSELHCSAKQASGAVILTGNGLFGRSWKTHNQDKEVIDLDTAPHVRQMRETGQALTALCLSEIVEEMMKDGGGVITYHDDGRQLQCPRYYHQK